jgi:predicted enzyme related to lactoylglutathione lyase
VNFTGILIGTDNPARLVEYYTRLFGAPGWDDGGYTGWMFGPGGITVAAHSEVSGQNAQPGRCIWNLETPDVRGDFDRLRAAGAIVVKEPYGFEGMPPDALIATLADPDGNYFQLTSPMPDMPASAPD